MALSDTTPGEILSLVTVAGNPYHGLVEAGTLTLPNAATMAHPQPDGGRWYMTGRSILVQRHGWSAPARTPEEQSVDLAAGRQWLPYSIISGESAMFYGKPLGTNTWIYIDSGGDRWLASLIIPVGETVGTVQGQPVTVRLARFGDFSMPESNHDYVVMMPDLGQSSPVWDGFGDPGQMSHRLLDVLPNGSAALFMAYLSPGWAPAPVQDVVLALFEVEISGAGGAAIVGVHLRRNRAQSVGTVVKDEQYPTFATDAATKNSEVDFPQYSLWLDGTNEVIFNDYAPSPCTGGTKSEGSLKVVKRQNVGGVYDPPLPSGPYALAVWGSGRFGWGPAGFHEGSITRSIELAGAILSAYYSTGGVISTITIDATASWTVSHSTINEAVGPAVIREFEAQGSPGNCSLVETRKDIGSITVAKTNSIVGTFAIVIQGPGGVAYSKSYSGTRTKTFSETIEYVSGNNDGVMGFRGTVTTSSAFATSDGVTSGGTPTVQTSGEHFTSGSPSYDNPVPNPNDLHQPWHMALDFTNTLIGDGWVMVAEMPSPFALVRNGTNGVTRSDGQSWLASGGVFGRIYVTAARLGTAVVSAMESTRFGVDPSYEVKYIPPAVTPSGLTSFTQISVSSAWAIPSPLLHASHHPVTGDLALAFAPICWV